MYVRRFRKFSRRPRKFSRRPRRIGGRKKTGLRKMVKRILSRSLESKEYILSFNSGILSQTSASNFVSNTQYMMPALVSGTNNAQRIGDAVTVSSMILKGQVGMANATALTTAYNARVLVYSLKDYNQDTAGVNLPILEASNFLRSGGASTTVSGYNHNDIMLPVNKNRINVYYDKTFLCGTGYGTATTNSNATVPSQHKFYVNLSKHFKKFKYDENGTYPNFPLNADLWVTVLWNSVDDTVGAGTATGLVQLVNHVKYKDA